MAGAIHVCGAPTLRGALVPGAAVKASVRCSELVMSRESLR